MLSNICHEAYKKRGMSGLGILHIAHVPEKSVNTLPHMGKLAHVLLYTVTSWTHVETSRTNAVSS